MMSDKKAPSEIASIKPRNTHWSVYAIDRSAGVLIRGGGIMVIFAVIAIIVFIASEAFPLFQSADSGKISTPDNAPGYALDKEQRPLLSLADANRRLHLTLSSSGEFIMTSTTSGEVVDRFRPKEFEGRRAISASVSKRPRRVVKLSRWSWQLLGERTFREDPDLGRIVLDRFVPDDSQREISEDGSKVTHFFTNYFDGEYEHDDEVIDLWDKDFEAIVEGVPTYTLSVLLDDGSTHLVRAAFYSTFHSFDPRFVPEELKRLSHPSEEEFTSKTFRPDAIVLNEHHLRGMSKVSRANGSESHDESGRPIRYSLLSGASGIGSESLELLEKTRNTRFKEMSNYYGNWYPGRRCIAEKRPGFGKDRGRALLTYRSSAVDIAVDYSENAEIDGNALRVSSDALPSDYSEDKEQRRQGKAMVAAKALISDQNRVYLTIRDLDTSNVDTITVSPMDEDARRVELLPSLFDNEHSGFSAPVVDVLVSIPENVGHVPVQATVVLENGWVYPFLVVQSQDDDDHTLQVTPRGKAFNAFDQDWNNTLDRLGAKAAELKLTRAGDVLGNTTIILGDSRGGLQAYFPVRDKLGVANYQRIRTYDPCPDAILTFAPSQRSKSFLVGDASGTLRGINMTTGRHFLEELTEIPLETLHYGREGDGIYGWDQSNHLNTWWFDAPHADASFLSIFGKVHYESFQEPIFEWQSTGLDESEPKLSLVPLVLGTFKGAIYAMLFSIPIAIAAALYTSEFMGARLRSVIKPIMEVMASLPSVVLGFVAALVLAPLFEAHVSSILLMAFLTPIFFLLAGWVWQQLPPTIRGTVNPIALFAILIGILSLSTILAFSIGSSIEPTLFPASESSAAGDVDPKTFELIDRPRVGAERVDGEGVTPAERLEGGNILTWSRGGRALKEDVVVEYESGESLAYPKGWWIPGGNGIFTALLILPFFLLLNWFARVAFTGSSIVWPTMKRRRWLPYVSLRLKPLHLWKNANHGLHPVRIGNSLRDSIDGGTRSGLRPVFADTTIAFTKFSLILGLSILIVFAFGGLIESLLFSYDHPSAGQVVDFRRFVTSEDGWDFNPQVNSLIVSVAMGFAVIPIIYTISEDALSTVPNQLRAASLGCGASPWQTAIKVVLPAAMPGIFSAVVIGFGRAIGETMIVLMAAGGKPITEWNPLSGFQSLSAAIATEIPEAAKDGTLYRTLFLAGVLLFAMTFVLNTVAEIVRLRLRRKLARV